MSSRKLDQHCKMVYCFSSLQLCYCWPGWYLIVVKTNLICLKCSKKFNTNFLNNDCWFVISSVENLLMFCFITRELIPFGFLSLSPFDQALFPNDEIFAEVNDHLACHASLMQLVITLMSLNCQVCWKCWRIIELVAVLQLQQNLLFLRIYHLFWYWHYSFVT